MLATNTDPDSDPAEEKLRWAFKVYDKDSSGELGTWKLETGKQLTTNVQIAGTIDCKELKEIVGNLYESEGYSQVVLSVALVDSLQLSYYHVTDTRPFVASQHVNTVCFCDCIFSSHS